MAGFRKATKEDKYLRMAIQGASGAGKTRSALEIAKYLCAPGKRIALIDSENSASLYSDVVDFDVDDDFGPLGKLNFHQDVWMKKMHAAATAGYGVIILDSATHLWKGEGGFLSQIDSICTAQRAKGGKGDSFAAWRVVDPLYVKFMNFVRQLPLHVILCVRAKVEYEKRNEGGKGSVVKVGMSPEFRDNYEYDLDLQASIDMEHTLVPLKHRLGDCLDGKVFNKAGKEFAEICLGWLSSGAPGQIDAVQAAVPVSPPPPARVQNSLPTTVPPLPEGVEEEGPKTTPMPPSTPDVSVGELLIERIKAATTIAELEQVRDPVKKAHADKLLPDEIYKKLSHTYAAQKKALTSTVAA